MNNRLNKRFLYAKHLTGIIRSNFRDLTMHDAFKHIYRTNYWKGDESVSGTGSSLIQTEKLRIFLEEAFEILQIRKILDLPCGDFNWMSLVNLENIDYQGADIVEELIAINQLRFSKENIKFSCFDITKDELPAVDLLICRDCLVHFSMADIEKAIQNIVKSPIKYLLLTTFEDRNYNYNICTGDWRPVNFQIYPFYFPEPILKVNENCTEEFDLFADKCSYIYELSSFRGRSFNFRVSTLKSILHVLFSKDFE